MYAPAIENNLIYPASIVPDTKISIAQGNGTYWQPTNYGNSITNQFLTVRYALFKSLNNPVIKIYQAMLQKGINAGEYLKKMGITEGIGEDEYQKYRPFNRWYENRSFCKRTNKCLLHWQMKGGTPRIILNRKD